MLYQIAKHADAAFPRLNKVWFENSAECVGTLLDSKEASTVLCSVVKHLGSGRALKK